MIVPILVFAQLGSVQFETHVAPETVYVGQQVTYEAFALVGDAARASLRANPEYTPGEVRGATTYDFPFETASVDDAYVNGAHYRRYAYRRALFPLAPGTYDVPAASLAYELPDRPGLSATWQRYTLASPPAQFVALPLPAAGKPVGFGGAVGRFTDTLRLDGSTPRLGDTFVLTLRVSGVGNLDLLPRPPIDVPWALVVEGDERVLWDSAGTVVRGAKEFDWVVTPRILGNVTVLPVRFDYFDPTLRRYVAATTSPLPVTVGPAARSDSAVIHIPDDAIGASPFPVLVRFLRANALAVGIAASVVLLLAVVAAVRGRRTNDD